VLSRCPALRRGGGFHLSGSNEPIIPETVEAMKGFPQRNRGRPLHRLAGGDRTRERVRQFHCRSFGCRQAIHILIVAVGTHRRGADLLSACPRSHWGISPLMIARDKRAFVYRLTFTCLISRVNSTSRCNTVWYKSFSKGGVYEPRETGGAFCGAKDRRVVPLEGGAVIAYDWARLRQATYVHFTACCRITVELFRQSVGARCSYSQRLSEKTSLEGSLPVRRFVI
jgi:hypothetical protein